jgi:hypothetical protein
VKSPAAWKHPVMQSSRRVVLSNALKRWQYGAMIPSGKHKVTRQMGYILEKIKLPRLSYLLFFTE